MTERWDHQMPLTGGQRTPVRRGGHVVRDHSESSEELGDFLFPWVWGLRRMGDLAFAPGWWPPNCFSCFSSTSTGSWILWLTPRTPAFFQEHAGWWSHLWSCPLLGQGSISTLLRCWCLPEEDGACQILFRIWFMVVSSLCGISCWIDYFRVCFKSHLISSLLSSLLRTPTPFRISIPREPNLEAKE